LDDLDFPSPLVRGIAEGVAAGAALVALLALGAAEVPHAVQKAINRNSEKRLMSGARICWPSSMDTSHAHFKWRQLKKYSTADRGCAFALPPRNATE
jgi:hypothetical protein